MNCIRKNFTLYAFSILLLTCCIAAESKGKWIPSDVSQVRTHDSDVLSDTGKSLKAMVGRRVRARGKFVSLKTGMGIMDLGNTATISFDPIAIPKNGELTVRYEIAKYRTAPNDFKMKVFESGGRAHDKLYTKRAEKLKVLNAHLKPGELIAVSGTLCHYQTITVGDYELFPNVNSSHFFFSIDDLALETNNPEIDFVELHQ